MSAIIPLPPFPFKSTPWSEKKKKKASFSLSWASLLLMEGGKKGLTLYPPFPIPRPTERQRSQPTKKWKGKVREGPASVRDVLLTINAICPFLPPLSFPLLEFAEKQANKSQPARCCFVALVVFLCDTTEAQLFHISFSSIF